MFFRLNIFLWKLIKNIWSIIKHMTVLTSCRWKCTGSHEIFSCFGWQTCADHSNQNQMLRFLLVINLPFSPWEHINLSCARNRMVPLISPVNWHCCWDVCESHIHNTEVTKYKIICWSILINKATEICWFWQHIRRSPDSVQQFCWLSPRNGSHQVLAAISQAVY